MALGVPVYEATDRPLVFPSVRCTPLPFNVAGGATARERHEKEVFEAQGAGRRFRRRGEVCNVIN